MRRRIWIIADDYGLSPAVDAGILALLDEERLSGTGCMTVFPDWFAAAARLRPHLAQRAVGLHLTLTDHPALTGRSPLAPDGRLPCLAELLMKTLTGRLRRPVADELDAQWHRFEAALGCRPLFSTAITMSISCLRCAPGSPRGPRGCAGRCRFCAAAPHSRGRSAKTSPRPRRSMSWRAVSRRRCGALALPCEDPGRPLRLA